MFVIWVYVFLMNLFCLGLFGSVLGNFLVRLIVLDIFIVCGVV